MKLTKEIKKDLKDLNCDELLIFAINNYIKCDGQLWRAQEGIINKVHKTMKKHISDYDEVNMINAILEKLRK